MSTKDIFNRKNEIIESMNLDVTIPLTEGFGSSIVEILKKIKKAVVDFFKRLIQRFKNFRDRLFNRGGGSSTSSSNNNDNEKSKETEDDINKKKKEQEEYRKKSEEGRKKWEENQRKQSGGGSKNSHGFNKQDIIRKAKSSNIELDKPVQNPKSYSSFSSTFDSILGDAEDVVKKFENIKDYDAFKTNVLNSLFSVGKEDNIPKYIKAIMREKKKIKNINQVDFDTYFEYIDSNRIIDDFKKQEKRIMKNLDDAGGKFTHMGAEFRSDQVKKYKYVLQVQLKATQLIEKEIEAIMSECATLAKKVQNA